MSVTQEDLDRAHNLGEIAESEGRSDAYMGLEKAFFSDEEREAYNKGVENVRLQNDS